QGFLPDSLAVRDLADRLGSRENDEINRLSDRFDDYLKRGLLIPGQGPQNIGTVLQAIRRIDAQSRLLHDPRLPGAFAEQTSRALQAGNTTLAQALVTAGLGFDSNDPALADLRDQVQRAVGQQQLLVQRKSLEASLAGLTGANAAFADIDAKRAQLDELRGIAPDSPVLASVQQLAQRGVSAQVARLESTAQHAQALEVIARYADLLPTHFVDQQRQKLASERGAFQAEQAAIGQIKTRIDTLLQSEKADANWSAQFDRALRQLTAYVSASDPYVVQAKTRAAQAYVAEARTLRTAQRLTEAAGMLDQARKYAPQSVDAEAKLLADARSAQQAALQERNRLAQVDALKTKLLVQARANEVNEALTSFQELRTNLPASDAYLTQQAPQAIGNAYLRLASNAARDGRFANAASLTSRAKEISPTLQDLAAASERYGRYQVIEATLKSSSAIDGVGTRAELERLGRQDAREAAAVNERLASEFGARIRSVSDPAEAKRLTAVAQQVFGSALATKILSEAAAKAPPTSQVPATPATDATASAGAGSGNAGNAGTAAPTAAGAAGPAGGTASSARTTGQNNTRLAMARPNSSAAADQAGAG